MIIERKIKVYTFVPEKFGKNFKDREFIEEIKRRLITGEEWYVEREKGIGRIKGSVTKIKGEVKNIKAIKKNYFKLKNFEDYNY